MMQSITSCVTHNQMVNDVLIKLSDFDLQIFR